jgi:hypothetical protein
MGIRCRGQNPGAGQGEHGRFQLADIVASAHRSAPLDDHTEDMPTAGIAS